MTYRETIMDNLSSTKELFTSQRTFPLESKRELFLHTGYIDKALKLLMEDRDKIDTLNKALHDVNMEKQAIRPRSGVFYCFCGQCGNPMQKADSFCSHCGKKIDWQRGGDKS